MEERFNLHETVVAVQNALYAVICHMLFVWALHGLVMGLVVGSIGFVLHRRNNRYGKPLMAVCRRLCVFTLVFMAPGLLAIVTQGHLPAAGVFNVNSLGFVVFWSLICVHLSAEEMNHRWFQAKQLQE